MGSVPPLLSDLLLVVSGWVHRRGPGRPDVTHEICALIVRMAQENPG